MPELAIRAGALEKASEYRRRPRVFKATGAASQANRLEKWGQTEPGKYRPAAQGAEGKEDIGAQFN
jgi:hypothetical protein